MNKVTPEIINAINLSAEKNGSLSQLAVKINVSHGTLSRYISGKVKNIHPATWRQLLPEIYPFLPPDYVRSYVPGFGTQHTKMSEKTPGQPKKCFECFSREDGIVLKYSGPHGIVLTVEVSSDNLQLLALMQQADKMNLMEQVYQAFEDIYNDQSKRFSAAPLEIPRKRG